LVWEGARLTGAPVSVRHDPLLLAVKYGKAAVCAERWVGDLIVPETGEYELAMTSDDASRLSLDWKLLLSRWQLDYVSAGEKIFLKRGGVSIVIELVECGGSRTLEARWGGSGMASERIPASALRWRSQHVRDALSVRPDPPISIAGVDASGRPLAVPL